jgi:DNA-binding CsgD family transcriptional regulator
MVHPRRPAYEPTPRQREVLAAVATTATLKDAARELGLTHSTVRTHAANARQGARVQSTRALIITAYEQGWLDLPDSYRNDVSMLRKRVDQLERERQSLLRTIDALPHEIERLSAPAGHYLVSFDHHLRAWASGDPEAETQSRQAMANAADDLIPAEILARARKRVGGGSLDRLAATITRRDLV